MKTTEIRNLSEDELHQQLSDKVDELFRLRVRGATERVENTALRGNLRKTVARIKTILAERTRQAGDKA